VYIATERPGIDCRRRRKLGKLMAEMAEMARGDNEARERGAWAKGPAKSGRRHRRDIKEDTDCVS
jgi:hypothetical protein